MPRSVSIERVAGGLVCALILSAGLVLATPGSLIVSTPLQRSTLDVPIKIKTQPNDLTDLLVSHVRIQPGGHSGWHSHPGAALVAVKSGVVALYDSEDPTCTPKYVEAGEAFVEEPGHVHLARNEGVVEYEAYSTFVIPRGVPSRTDAPNPGNCPF